MLRPNKGASLTTVLLTLALFSILFLAFSQWATNQCKSAVKIYQDFQAVQLAENQAQRQFLGLPCYQSVLQNGLHFRIQCYNDRVIVGYPMGEIWVKIE